MSVTTPTWAEPAAWAKYLVFRPFLIGGCPHPPVLFRCGKDTHRYERKSMSVTTPTWAEAQNKPVLFFWLEPKESKVQGYEAHR